MLKESLLKPIQSKLTQLLRPLRPQSPQEPGENLSPNLLPSLQISRQFGPEQKSFAIKLFQAVIIGLPLVFLFLRLVVLVYDWQLAKVSEEKADIQEKIVLYKDVESIYAGLYSQVETLKTAKSEYKDLSPYLHVITTKIPPTVTLSNVTVGMANGTVKLRTPSPIDFARIASTYFKEGIVSQIILKSANYDISQGFYEVDFDLILK